MVKVKWSCYRPGVTQRVGRGIALLFHDRGTRRGLSGQQHAPAALYPRERHPVPILQEAGRAPGPVCTGGKSRPHRDSIPDRPDRSQSLYRLSYPAHISSSSSSSISISISTSSSSNNYCSMWATAPTEYAKRHDGLAKVIHQKLAEAAELIADKSPYYKYTPANVLENENFKLYWIPAYLRTKQYTLIDLT